jgi:hypothetical protein
MKLSLTFRNAALGSLALLVLACSDAVPSEPIVAPQPAKVLAPPKATVDQGRNARLAIELSGAIPSEVVLRPTEGIAAVLEGNELVVSAGYDAPQKGSVVIEAKGARAEVAIDVRVLDWKARVTWQAGKGPVAREHATFFEDDDKRAVYMLQGSGYEPQGEPLSDAYAFDVAARTWTPWSPTGDVPEPAGGRRSAKAPGTNVHYLYGGYLKGDKDSADIYRVDLGNAQKTFTKLVSAGAAPVGRSLHAFAFDAKGSRVVVFGGVSYATTGLVVGDTWLGAIAGDTVTWTQLTPEEKPSPRYGAFTGFDPKTRKLVVWSGAQRAKSGDQVNAAQDAWALDLSKDPPTWANIPLGDAPPPGRRNGCGIFEPTSQRLFVFGGTKDAKETEPGLFALDLSAKEPRFSLVERTAQPPLRSSGFGFVDAKTGDVYCGFGNSRSAYLDLNVLGYAP